MSDVFLGERSGDEMLPSAVAKSWDDYCQIQERSGALLSDVRATIGYQIAFVHTEQEQNTLHCLTWVIKLNVKL